MISNPGTGTIAAGGMGGMLAIVIVWIFGLFNIAVPPDVAIALAFVIISAFAFVVHQLPPPRAAEIDKALADAIELAKRG